MADLQQPLRFIIPSLSFVAGYGCACVRVKGWLGYGSANPPMNVAFRCLSSLATAGFSPPTVTPDV